MPWDEFCTLVAGLMPDTPLGQIVSIRMEDDPKVIKSFNSNQRKIHSEWKKRRANKLLENPEQFNRQMDSLAKMFESVFGIKEVKPHESK